MSFSWDTVEAAVSNERLPDGTYDFTVTAFEGYRAKFGSNPPTLKVQLTVDNGDHVGQSVTNEFILEYDGRPDDRTLGSLKGFALSAGLDEGDIPIPFDEYPRFKHPVDYAAEWQRLLASQGDHRYRVSGRIYTEYQVDRQKKNPDTGRWWTREEWTAASGEKNDYLRVSPAFGKPQGAAETKPAPRVPAAAAESQDPLDGVFGGEDPTTKTAAYSPSNGPAPF